MAQALSRMMLSFILGVGPCGPSSLMGSRDFKTMRIDSNSGNLLFGPESVGPALKEDEFLNSALAHSAAKVRQTALANWYELWLTDSSGRDVGVVLAFVPHGQLIKARLNFVKPEVRAAGEWSTAVEDEMKSFHDNWLRGQLGEPPYEFHWGRIWSAVDQHGYSAVIICQYKCDS